jgi:hypothetical protein
MDKATQREQWRLVLDAELRRWSAMSGEQLLTELQKIQAYEVEVDSKKYQVEVEIVENTEKYFQVVVAVDDGTLPSAVRPLTASFVRGK